MKHDDKSEKSVTKDHRPVEKNYSEYEHTSTQTESRIAFEGMEEKKKMMSKREEADVHDGNVLTW